MQKHCSRIHPRNQQRRECRREAAAPTGFLDAWRSLIDGFDPPLLKRRGRRARVPLTQLLPALIFHFMNGAGTLAEHFYQLFDTPLADSSWSDRRTRLPWEVFTDLMGRALRPRATRHHRGAFWGSLRLVAIDGTQFSVTNTPQISSSARGPTSRLRRASDTRTEVV